MTRSLPRNSRTCVLILVLGTSAAFVGCKKKEPQPAAPPPAAAVAKPAAPPAKPVQKPVSSALKLPPPQVNQFDFSTKKDPFKPFVAPKAQPSLSQENARKAMRPTLPIHNYDVSQFKLIGIVTGGKDNHAMVTDPSGKGYVLKIGMTIGKNEGRITAITTTGVDVLEQFRDDNGRVLKEHIRITLPRKQ